MRLTLALVWILNLAHACEVMTISDSIVDYILYVNEDYVRSLPGKKGGSALVDDLLFQKIVRDSHTEPMIRPGSSGVNMLKGLNRLGHNCCLLTTVGDDLDGDFFLQSLRDQGITLFLQVSPIPTGKSACLVTPNGERTMRTFLGASQENNKLQLKEEMFQNTSHLHIEGYQLYYHDLIRKSIELAKSRHATVSIDLASFEFVSANKHVIWELLEKGMIDLIFANHEEAFTLTGLTPKKAADFLAGYCKVAVITMGEKGCYVSKGPSQWHCPAFKVDVIDTIGAGDLFVSGFLHGFLTHQPIPKCASLGTLLASQVVQVIGGEIPLEQWHEIYQQIEADK